MTVAGMLQGHDAETRQRILERCGTQPVLVAQDSTEFNYSGHRADPDLGRLSGDSETRGLHAHSALAPTVSGLPLGMLYATYWTRNPAERGKKHQRQQRPTEEKESQKWLDALAGIEAELPAGQAAVVVADREADFFDYFAAARRPETQLLVRAHQPRRVEVECAAAEDAAVGAAPATRVTDLRTAVGDRPGAGSLPVSVPARPGQPAREATLTLRWVAVRLLVPRDYRRRHVAETPRPTPLRVWVLEAREEDPPAGTEPLHWVLVTTLPVSSAQECARVIEYYRRRWTIERLHYTLKSGLRVERLQCDDTVSLQRALALCWVVAWYLLWLTHLAREEPEGPATEVLTADEGVVLAAAEKRPVRTRREVVRAIAKLGGFPGNPSAGEPGVKTL